MDFNLNRIFVRDEFYLLNWNHVFAVFYCALMSNCGLLNRHICVAATPKLRFFLLLLILRWRLAQKRLRRQFTVGNDTATPKVNIQFAVRIRNMITLLNNRMLFCVCVPFWTKSATSIFESTVGRWITFFERFHFLSPFFSMNFFLFEERRIIIFLWEKYQPFCVCEYARCACKMQVNRSLSKAFLHYVDSTNSLLSGYHNPQLHFE